MPSSPSSSAQAARQRLADQLKETRTAARISGVAFAAAAGWRDSSLVSRTENGQRPISADTVRLWCRVCGASQQRAEELLAEQRAAAGLWLTHQQLNRGGLKVRQDQLRNKYERVKLHRVYQTKVIPGLLQTQALTTAYLTTARLEQHLELDDVAEAVAARMDRQRVPYRPDARWLFVLEEDVLWYRPASDEVHIQQLRHLLEVMRRPSVSLGVIPRQVRRQGVCPEESFTMTDAELVTVELVSGTLTLTHRDLLVVSRRAPERSSRGHRETRTVAVEATLVRANHGGQGYRG